MRKKLKHIFVTVVTATNPATLTAAVSENVSYNSFIVSINWKAFLIFCVTSYISMFANCYSTLLNKKKLLNSKIKNTQQNKTNKTNSLML